MNLQNRSMWTQSPISFIIRINVNTCVCYQLIKNLNPSVHKQNSVLPIKGTFSNPKTIVFGMFMHHFI